ncbi:MAG: FAD-binding oxidoreductase [Pseudomonadota bacterium]
MATADVIIIGTGVIGSAIALELARAGRKVVSVDRNRQVGHGSTAASSAVVRTFYSTWDGTALAHEGFHHWQDFANDLDLPAGNPVAEFRPIGCLIMHTEQNQSMAPAKAHADVLGIPHEDWSADDLAHHLPAYDFASFAPPKPMDHAAFGEPNGDSITGATFWPRSGYVNDPALAAQNLASAAAHYGATRRMGETVTGILKSSGRVAGVELATGEKIHAPVVINVAGPASSHINHLAGVGNTMGIATRAVQQEVVHLKAPPKMWDGHTPMLISDGDIGCYCKPDGTDQLFIGTEGPACDPHVMVADEAHFERQFSDQWTLQAMRYGQRAPQVGIPGQASGIVDLYDASDDWIPIYDKSDLPGFFMACGTSGNQFKNAPVVGKIMAALIAHEEAGNDHDKNPLRFTLPKTDVPIDTGFYTRKRKGHGESSFSVLG